MRTIKSVWTKPPRFFFEGLEELTSLSIIYAAKYTGGCEVYADELGAEWIKALRLPVSKVTTDLKNCPGDGAVWNEGKIFANVIQTTPFLQTDLDVILGRDWSNRVKSGAVVTERAYNLPHEWLNKLPLVMPSKWEEAALAIDPRAFACGTFGGNDLAGIRRIGEAGLGFIARNREAIRKLDSYLPVVVAEEWAVMREYDWQEVTTVLPSLPDGATFAELSRSYMHVVGPSKRREDKREEIRRRLREVSPMQLEVCKSVRKWIASVKP